MFFHGERHYTESKLSLLSVTKGEDDGFSWPQPEATSSERVTVKSFCHPWVFGQDVGSMWQNVTASQKQGGSSKNHVCETVSSLVH